MRNTTLYTPPAKNTRNSSIFNYKSASNKSNSVKKRKPIFQAQKYAFRNTVNYASNLGNFHDQRITSEQLISYDFCGCQNQVIPCDIVQNTFLKNVSLAQMKLQYGEISQQQNQLSTVKINQTRKQNLFKTLPKIYPQLYYTHLNNLLHIIGDDMNWAQFSCLSWIQYHSKVEYVTYFLYQDLKKSFKNKTKFIDRINDELLKKGSNYPTIRAKFTAKGYADILQKFLSAFYDSVGANLVPLTYYAKLIRIIFKHGNTILFKLLVNFIHKKTTELEAALRYLNYGEITFYRNYLRQLNWEAFLEELQQ